MTVVGSVGRVLASISWTCVFHRPEHPFCKNVFRPSAQFSAPQVALTASQPLRDFRKPPNSIVSDSTPRTQTRTFLNHE